jgi:hypothetical protein
VIEPTPHIQATAARLICPVDGTVLEWTSERRPDIHGDDTVLE